LSAWHPADDSARALLAPWRRVFEPRDWDALLVRGVVPKLAAALAGLVVDPAAQDLEPLRWVLAWDGLVPGERLAALFEQLFFPQWTAVLRRWLSAPSPDFDEVTRWYLAWKGLLPQGLLDQPRVRAGFAAALNLMNAAADGGPLPPPAPPPAQQPQQQWGDGAAAAAADGADGVPPQSRGEPGSRWGGLGGASGGGGASAAAAATSAHDPTLRELVAQYATDAGFEFLPKPGRTHDGLQVYSFGGVSCVLEPTTSTIRAAVGAAAASGAWAPVSLERLAAEAEARRRGAAARGQGRRRSCWPCID
jgi:tuftelin-interacting protein 11